MRRLRVVADANILASGFIAKPGRSSHEIIRLWRAGLFDLLFTGTLIAETEATLRALGTSDDLVNELIELLCSNPDTIVGLSHQRLGSRDEHDDHLFEAALEGNAAIIVSRDGDVLNPPKALEDLLRRRGVKVMSDVQFLEHVRRTVFSPLSSSDAVNIADLIEAPDFSCPLCAHRFHWDFPCADVCMDSSGEPLECLCFAQAVTAAP